MKKYFFGLAVYLTLGLFSPMANAAELVTVETPSGGKLKFILIKPENPKAAVVLFTGGNGWLNLSEGVFGGIVIDNGANNFLVRSRLNFAGHGFMVAVVDSPEHKGKMNAIYRMSEEYADYIRAVVQYLKNQADIPVWMVGTSMGTFSAPNGAIAVKDLVDGLVVTSSITRSAKRWSIYDSHPDGVINMDLGKITVPVFVTSHKDDGCKKTPAADIEKLAAAFTKSTKVEFKIFEGGDKPQSKPCKALSKHGYIGIEDQVVGAIAAFIKAN